MHITLLPGSMYSPARELERPVKDIQVIIFVGDSDLHRGLFSQCDTWWNRERYLMEGVRDCLRMLVCSDRSGRHMCKPS